MGTKVALAEKENIVDGRDEMTSSERSTLIAAATEIEGAARRRSRADWTLGVVFVVIVALIWTFASVLVQYIFHDLSFQGPFFLTYMGISLFSLNLPFWYVSQVVWPRCVAWWRQRGRGRLEPEVSVQSRLQQARGVVGQFGVKQIVKISAIISPLWFLANFSYNGSLFLTSVTSSTIISSTSTVFTFLLSVCILHESFAWLKLAGVLLCMLGNITTVFHDNSDLVDDNEDHVVGDLVALFAAFMYGVYTTAIRRLIPDDESVSIALFFGFLGVINLVVLFPFVVLANISGLESLEGLTVKVVLLIVVKGLFDNVLSDYLWARAVLLTSPTVATVGLSLTVPFAILSDYVFHQTFPTLVTFLASGLVLSGFMLINVATKNAQTKASQAKSVA